ncbi:hypothetical protein AgCh_032814 [Apium graveolens]
MRNKAFWKIPIPSKASWCVKKILELRPLALSRMTYQVGNVSQFLFWHDPWSENCPLLHRFDKSIISISGTSEWVTVGSFIINQHWSFPPLNHSWIIDLRDQINSIIIEASDKLSWNGYSMAETSISVFWNSIRASCLSPPWIEVVWHPLLVPKCSFTLWLAFKNRLITKERMANFYITTNLLCVLCNNEVESNAHLFCTCPYASVIFTSAGFGFTCNWDSYLHGHFLVVRPSRMKKLLAYLYFSAVVY